MPSRFSEVSCTIPCLYCITYLCFVETKYCEIPSDGKIHTVGTSRTQIKDVNNLDEEQECNRNMFFAPINKHCLRFDKTETTTSRENRRERERHKQDLRAR